MRYCDDDQDDAGHSQRALHGDRVNIGLNPRANNGRGKFDPSKDVCDILDSFRVSFLMYGL